MKKYDFGICYEHAKREIESICLLSYELRRRGYSVFIYNTNDDRLKRRFKYAHFKVLIVPYAYDNRIIAFSLGTAFTCDKIVNLQWEQLFSKQQENDPCGYKTPIEIGKDVVHLSWGEANKRRLVNLASIDATKVFVVGNISFDFLREKLRNYYLDKAQVYKKYGIPTDKKVLLFVSSFKAAGVDGEALEQEVRLFGAWRREQNVYAKKCRTEIVRWIQKVLEEDENLFVIYRPHPGETIDYLNLPIERLRIISDLTIKQWILIVDGIYMWMSTVAVEAYFANKNCGLLSPFEPEDRFQMPIFDGANVIRTYEEFKKSIYYSMPFPLREDVINDYYSSTEKYSYIRIAEVCEYIYNSSMFLLDPQKLKKIVWNRFYANCSFFQVLKKRVYWSSFVQHLFDIVSSYIPGLYDRREKYLLWRREDCIEQDQIEKAIYNLGKLLQEK